MKNLFLSTILLLVVTVSYGQEKLVTRTGKVTFQSETAIENFTAENTQVASIFLVNEKTIVFNVLLKSFKFEKALMEEHFNEKYVNSDTYPSAKFKGIIEDDIDLSVPNTYENVTVIGEMSFHGETKPLTVKADIVVNTNKSIQLKSNFKLNLESYKVEIPSLVKEKISEDILVSVETKYIQ